MSISRGMEKDVIHIYDGMLAIKSNESMPFAQTLGGPRDCHTE